ncbi:MAG: response regulator, partial [Thermodesulfovibrionales bacterium]|nr:response regulator [Thermodesulfovibrionales bacterium]
MAKYAELFKAVKKEDSGDKIIGSGEITVPEQKRFTLLFVDDEENVLQALRRIFLDENYEILTATSGVDALKIMESTIVHLVISDHRMPGMIGSELLREIKNRWPETIRIMLTGHADI